MFTNLPRAIRFLRLQKGWSQVALATKAGVSREFVSRLERHQVTGATFGNADRVVHALGGSLRVNVSWQGEQLDRLMDAGHASLQQFVAELLTGVGWVVRVEVSFNHYGDRGRVDLVAFHPRLRVLLVIELKTVLGDLQETLGRLDVKARLGRQLAHDLGWTDVRVVLPVLVIADSRSSRRIVSEHSTLFAHLPLRGRQALAWMRHPTGPMPTGLLWFANGPDSYTVTNARRRRAAKHPNARQP